MMAALAPSCATETTIAPPSETTIEPIFASASPLSPAVMLAAVSLTA